MAKLIKTISAAALAGLIAAPVALTSSTADAASCSSRKLTGTVIGGAGGALLGGAVTHGSTGPIVGALAGGVVGHEVGRSGCRKRTYYRTSRARSYRSAPASYYSAPRPEVRRVYYDQYGSPIAQDYVR